MIILIMVEPTGLLSVIVDTSCFTRAHICYVNIRHILYRLLTSFRLVGNPMKYMYYR